ncbi:MAG: Na/Pi symporter [bacterium]|nr:Na/Pi symporter [bacterium]
MNPSQTPPGRSLWLSMVLLVVLLILFFLAIEWMSQSFKLFGQDLPRLLLNYTSNPLVALFIGILATSLMQSSSATTSMVVAMVASGSLQLELAVPIMMGANIGTSVTNTLVSMAHINRSSEFRRAFSASIVHDFFNVLCVLVFFPLEYFTGFFHNAGQWLAGLVADVHGMEVLSPLKALVEPLARGVITQLTKVLPTDGPWHLHAWCSLLCAFTLLFLAIVMLTRVLKGVALSRAENWFEASIFRSSIRSLLIGVLLTIAVQSSSVSTSLIVPFAGAGLLSLKQIFPYTLGANLGTTITAMLAALSTQNPAAVAIAMVHTLFNAAGTALFLPLSRLPIGLASGMAELALRSRLIPMLYVLMAFFVVPLGLIFLLK